MFSIFFKSLLLLDDNINDSFFNSVLYGLLFKLTKNNRVSKDNKEGALGKEFFGKLSESKKFLQLDDSCEGFFFKYVSLSMVVQKKKSISNSL